METDKENVRRTKIPLPREPLPALPKHLLSVNMKQKQGINNVRVPLQTINSQVWSQAGPSKVKNKHHRFVMNVDTRHVTMRRRSEDLDWSYSVFKDKQPEQDSSVISISDDETYLDKGNHAYHDKNIKKKNNLHETESPATPHPKVSLEPSRIRNIKRSLKRPHSRELQGLSPLVKEQKLDDKVKRRLQFNERMQDKLDSTDFWKVSYTRCIKRDYTEDIYDYLLNEETKPDFVPNTSSITRACVINWLMKVNGADGNPSIIQTACWYLDSILGSGHVHLNKLQLVAAACYWIAQKIHGPVTTASRLVKCANKAFTADKLVGAEKIVLMRLRFPSQPVLVQDYITYLSWYCDQSQGGDIEPAATFLYMCGLMVNKCLCNEYPSVIAIAAVKDALILLKKMHLISRLEKCHIFNVAEKKAKNLLFISSVLRRAVLTVATPVYEYKAPLEQYDTPPHFIAHRIIKAANELYLLDPDST